jgi:TetR/AcrR family transcriptional regulator
MDEARLPRREREKLRQRREILEVALSLFAERGYHEVSMHEIAHRSEFAIGTLYKFFRNKEELYRTLLWEKAQAFHQELLLAIEEGKEEMESLRNYVRRKGELFRAHLPVIRLYFSESRGPAFSARSGLDAEIGKLHQDFLQVLSSVFARGIEKGRFQPIADPRDLALALDGITTAFLFRWLEAPERYSYPDDPDVILHILFRPLLRPDSSSSGSG